MEGNGAEAEERSGSAVGNLGPAFHKLIPVSFGFDSQ
jgi:hypothetical protein